MNKARTQIANCINADPKEICILSGGSESVNYCLKGSAFNER
jgi:cysteine sulfinate desulfinase/cysteine desulfurase-like protein